MANPLETQTLNVNNAIWIAALGCLLSAYFSACHTALKVFSRKRLANLLDKRNRQGSADRLIKHVGDLLLVTGILRAIFSLIIVLAVLYYTQVSFNGGNPNAPAGFGVYLIAFLISGALLSIFTVALPVSWAKYRSEYLLAWSARYLMAVLFVFTPVTWALSLFDPIVRRISGADLEEDDENAITDEVLSVVEDHQGEIDVDDTQKEMLEAVFDLSNTTAGEIMTPRTDVTGIDVSWPLQQVAAGIMGCGHSRIPVYEENLDHILGMLYAKDLIKFVGNGNSAAEFDIKTILRDGFMVPESKSVQKLLEDFKARKVHIAIVLDEYGGTAGLVTIEDILEELVGDIQDEYEPTSDEPHINVIDENTIEADAKLHIDDLNDQFDVDLPEDEDYDTLGGFVFSALGHIPDTGEAFDANDLHFTVTAAERTKVTKVKVEKLQSATLANSNSHNQNS